LFLGKTPGKPKRFEEGEIQFCTKAATLGTSKKYDIIDFELGVKITGAGFPVLKKRRQIATCAD
jgi:seryl-tRNA synthetase